MKGDRVTVQLLFADSGTFHQTQVTVPASLIDPYPRLIDALREDPELQKQLYLDLGRLSAAWIGSGSSGGRRGTAP
jgi:hypothetical protein